MPSHVGADLSRTPPVSLARILMELYQRRRQSPPRRGYLHGARPCLPTVLGRTTRHAGAMKVPPTLEASTRGFLRGASRHVQGGGVIRDEGTPLVGVRGVGALRSLWLKSMAMILALILLVACAPASTTGQHAPTPAPPVPTGGVAQQQTPVPGATTVYITLTEFRITSSIHTFQAGKPYYFIIMNKGHDIHEFMIMPDKPDGTPLPPDLQYKEMALEVEPIMPGTTWSVNFTFPSSLVGKAEFACQMGRHYQAGMRLPVIVT